MTSYKLTHFKKMVRVWKTKSLLFCLRYDPLMVFWRKNHITFIFIAYSYDSRPSYFNHLSLYNVKSAWSFFICETSIFGISLSELVPSIESLYHRDPRSRTVELIYINVSIKFSERGTNQNKAIERKESSNLGQWNSRTNPNCDWKISTEKQKKSKCCS